MSNESHFSFRTHDCTIKAAKTNDEHNRTKKMSNHKFALRQKLNKWKVMVAASRDAETFSVPTVHEWWKWIKWTNNVICERIGTRPREKNHHYKCVQCNCVSSSYVVGWMHALACDVIVWGRPGRSCAGWHGIACGEQKAISAIPLHARRTFNDCIFQTHIT